jgi:hypothetical protein
MLRLEPYCLRATVDAQRSIIGMSRRYGSRYPRGFWQPSATVWVSGNTLFGNRSVFGT